MSAHGDSKGKLQDEVSEWAGEAGRPDTGFPAGLSHFCRLSSDNRMVLRHCHGNSGCSGPQEVVFDSSVFIPYHCFRVTTTSLQGRREGGSSSSVNPVEMKRQWAAGDQGTNRHWHLLWLPRRGEGWGQE